MGGSESQFGTMDRVIKQQTAFLPLIEGSATIRARNDTDFNMGMFFCVSFGKAFRKASSGESAVRIYGTVHGLLSAVSQNLESAADGIKARCFLEITASCHIGLTDN